MFVRKILKFSLIGVATTALFVAVVGTLNTAVAAHPEAQPAGNDSSVVYEPDYSLYGFTVSAPTTQAKTALGVSSDAALKAADAVVGNDTIGEPVVTLATVTPIDPGTQKDVTSNAYSAWIVNYPTQYSGHGRPYVSDPATTTYLDALESAWEKADCTNTVVVRAADGGVSSIYQSCADLDSSTSAHLKATANDLGLTAK